MNPPPLLTYTQNIHKLAATVNDPKMIELLQLDNLPQVLVDSLERRNTTLRFDHCIVGDITIEEAQAVCEKLMSQKPRRDVSIFLSSAGGDVDGALSMGSAIQAVQREGYKVHIHIGAVAHSAAALLLQFADRRTMESYATLRLHPMYATYERDMTIADINGELNAISYAHYVYYEVIQRRTGRDIETDLIAKQHHLRQDVLLFPKDCLDWGLIDEVLDYSIPFGNQENTAPLGNSGVRSNVPDITSRRKASQSRTPSRRRKAS